ncbi:hypothetical protein DFJ74DRAFT_133075 [Hyaloraphidium curvatum]|nr:hypothetical protein DFJ74DRAFT_133075 [Hyaloraphidium curvatum]
MDGRDTDASPTEAPQLFSPLDWRLLFPSGARDDTSALLDEGDAATPAFEAAPPSNAEMARMLEKAPPLPFLVRLESARNAVSRGFGTAVLYVGFQTSKIALATVSVVALNDGRFGTQQIAAGIVAYSLQAVYSIARHMLQKGWLGDFGDSGTAGHALLQLATYLEGVPAAGDREKGADSSALLSHDSVDPLCPCDAAGCAGRFPSLAGAAAILTSLFWIAISSVLAVLFSEWTAFVTFGTTTWTSP